VLAENSRFIVRETFKKMSQKLDRYCAACMTNMRVGKPEFARIEAESLTMRMKRSQARRANL
jgi:hypothetical protein